MGVVVLAKQFGKAHPKHGAQLRRDTIRKKVFSPAGDCRNPTQAHQTPSLAAPTKPFAI
jgi:hypothetical protein